MKARSYLLVSVVTLFTLVGSSLYTNFRVAGSGRQMVEPPPTYRLTDLGTINQSGNMISHPAGINEAGQVTGNSRSGTSIHAARFTNGLVEDLGTIPGGDISSGWGINDFGDVAGDSQYSPTGCCRHAALFSNGTVTDLGFLPGWGNYARGNGINNSRQVVGHSGRDLDTNSTRAFIWDAALGMRDIGTIGGSGFAKAFSINNSGLVTGEASTGTGFGDKHAFIWSAALGMRDIGTIAGGFSDGAFINENGNVAGTSTINSFDNRHHAFLYDGTTMRDLGSLGPNHFFSDRSTGKGVNIHDHVVGSTYRPYEGGALTQIAFVYMNGQMYDLETLLDATGAGYRLYTATGINDAGQIAVDALKIGSPNQLRAVLLTPGPPATPTPTPTPATSPTPTPQPTPCGPPTDFANSMFMELPAYSNTHGIADPYPLNVVVNSMQGNITQMTVKLTALYHTAPKDLDFLLVGPGGQNAIIMSDAGFVHDAVNLTLTLDDYAAAYLPETGALTNGTFKPTNIGAGDLLPSPAPAPLGGSALSVFNGTNPNGTWSLYAFDDQQIDWGHMNGGWSLSISTDNCGSPTPAATPTPISTPTPTPTPTPANRTPFDFDGDGKADVSVFRPSDRIWYVNGSAAGFSATQFGLSDDKIAAADYDGDGRSDLAVYRPSEGNWYIAKSSDGTYSTVRFGIAGDIAAPGDFDGDDRADIALFRPSTGTWYYIQSSDNASRGIQFGQSGDIPVTGDFDGDGKADIVVFRPSNGYWYWMGSADNQPGLAYFGHDGDIPLSGDFNGDGRSDLAVFRPSDGIWYVARPRGVPAQSFDATHFGIATDKPVPADYDGDGKTDIAVFRDGTWYIRQSSAGFAVQNFGLVGDTPVPVAH